MDGTGGGGHSAHKSEAERASEAAQRERVADIDRQVREQACQLAACWCTALAIGLIVAGILIGRTVA